MSPQLPADLPRDLAAYVAPRITWTTSIPLACATSHDGKVSIKVNPEAWSQLDSEAQATILLHEVMHIIRGDLSTVADNPVLANIAQDMIINAIIDINPMARHGLRCPVYDEHAARTLNLPSPPPLPSWRTIYDRLADTDVTSISQPATTSDSSSTQPAACSTHSQPGSPPDPAEVLAAAKAAAGAGIDIPPPTAPQVIDILPASCRVLDQLLQQLRAIGARSRVTARTWRREGRTPHTRGQMPLPTLDVLVAVDVSGSMEDTAAKLAGLARCSDIKPRWVAFATSIIARWDTPPATLPRPQGGTMFRPVLDEATRHPRPDVLVMVTDGWCHDQPSPIIPPPTTIWIVPFPTSPIAWPGMIINANDKEQRCRS